MFAFLITSHRNPAIDCCKCSLIFSRTLHYLTFVLNTKGRMTSVGLSVCGYVCGGRGLQMCLCMHFFCSLNENGLVYQRNRKVAAFLLAPEA